MPEIVQAVPPTMPELLPAGTVVGRHCIDTSLREGGMATIYLASHVETGARVAVKILNTEYVHQPDFIARFDREASVMGRLSGCPQIVSVHDVGSLPDGRRYLVMDFVRGHDLRDELDQLRGEEAPMDVGRAVSILRDVAAGLSVAHRMNVVHRDIKPSNIMLEHSAGRELAKLVDFGISADLDEKGLKQDLTAGGTIIGTARYMAPEQAAGISSVASVDIWAMGVILIEMLTGEPPPDKGWGLRGADLTALPPIPDSLRNLIEAMVQPDSTLRLQSAAEAETRLLEILPEVNAGVSLVATIDPTMRKMASATAMVPPPAATADLRATPPPIRPTSAPHKSSNAPLLWGMLTAMMLMCLGAVGWWWWDRISKDASNTAHDGETAEVGDTSEDVVSAADGVANDDDEVANDDDEVANDNDEVANDDDEVAAAVQPEPVVQDPFETADPPEAPADTEATAAEEADPQVEAEAEPEPEPDPKPKPRRRPASRSKKGSAKPDSGRGGKPSGDCTADVAAAREASKKNEWKTVLTHTRKASCWSNKTERERLRVRAYLKTNQFKRCEKEGQESGDPVVSGMVNVCRDNL